LGFKVPNWFKYSKKIGLAGCGTQTAALAFGGGNPGPATGATEEYDGSTWATAPGSLNTARKLLGWSRYTNSSFSFGGELEPFSYYRSNRRI
jgi:hypothetical protein